MPLPKIFPVASHQNTKETTLLNPEQEAKYKQWLMREQIPNADSPESRYDMRGYFRDIAATGQNQTEISKVDQQRHFPDTYKQHGHPSFSSESKYSRGPQDGGKWLDETLVAPPVASHDSMLPARKIPSRNIFHNTGINPAATPSNIFGGLKALKEDAAEAIIRKVASTDFPERIGYRKFVPEVDTQYLRQFTHPDENVLPLTDARPRFLSNIDKSAKWRAMRPGNTPAANEANLYREPDPETGNQVYFGRQHESEESIPSFGTAKSDQVMGLGNYRESLGKDEKGKEIGSILDKWDFDSPGMPKPIGWFLNHVMGKPFYVYERGDITPETHEDIYGDQVQSIKFRGAEKLK